MEYETALVKIKTEDIEDEGYHTKSSKASSIILSLKPKENNEKGIFVLTAIPKGAKLGPYDELDGVALATGYGWQIANGKLVTATATKSWMYYVNCTTSNCQNLTVFQNDGLLYFKALKDIDVGEELLVQYELIKVEELNGERLCVPCIVQISKNEDNDVHPVICKNIANTDETNSSEANNIGEVEVKRLDELSNVKMEVDINQIEHVTLNGYPLAIKSEFNNESIEADQQTNNEVAVDALNIDPKDSDVTECENTSKEQKKTDIRKFACSFCKFTTNNNKIFQKHCREKHNVNFEIAKPFKCPVCDRRLSDEKFLETHMYLHTGYKNFHCTLCDYKCIRKKSLVFHMQKQHQGRAKNTCPVCSYRCYNQGELQKHMQTHSEEQRKSSMPADSILQSRRRKNTRRNFKSERRFVESREKPHKCPKCNYSTADKKNYYAHLKRHRLFEQGIKPYVCQICGDSYVNNSNLKIHMVKHTGQKPFECRFCEYRTDIKGSLTVHYNTVHEGQEDFFCDVCPAKRFDEEGLEYHKRVHKREIKRKIIPEEAPKAKKFNKPGEKRYQCAHCVFETDNEKLYYQHIRRQHNVRETPYKCKLCGKCFMEKSYLRLHANMHSADKQYKCEYCEFQSIWKTPLFRHMKRLHPDKPAVQCQECNYICFTEEVLKVHSRSHAAK